MIELLVLAVTLAGAFDTFAPDKWKIYIGEVVSGTLSQDSPALNASAISNRIFGPRLISLRSIFASIVLSVIFFIIMASIAIYINRDLLSSYFDEIDNLNISATVVIFICIIFAIFADFVSYLKARMFISASRGQKLIVSVTLLFGDFLGSIIVFAIIFSMGLSASYAYLSLREGPEIESTFRFSPELTYNTAKAIGIAFPIEPPDNASKFQISIISLLNDVNELTQKGDSSSNEMLEVSAKFHNVIENDEYDFYSYNSDYKCISKSDFNRIANTSTIDIFLNTSIFLIKSGAPAVDKLQEERWDDLASKRDIEARRISQKSRNDCAIKYVEINGIYNTKNMIKWIHPLDIYLAVLSSTLNNVFINVTNKFSLYHMLDIRAEVKDTIGNAWIASALTFGRNQADQSKIEIARIVRGSDKFKSGLVIPFTSLVASSLGASILLWAVLILNTVGIWSFYLRNFVSQSLSNDHISKYTATFIVFIVGCLFLIIWLSWWAASYIWYFALHYIVFS